MGSSGRAFFSCRSFLQFHFDWIFVACEKSRSIVLVYVRCRSSDISTTDQIPCKWNIKFDIMLEHCMVILSNFKLHFEFKLSSVDRRRQRHVEIASNNVDALNRHFALSTLTRCDSLSFFIELEFEFGGK